MYFIKMYSILFQTSGKISECICGDFILNYYIECDIISHGGNIKMGFKKRAISDISKAEAETESQSEIIISPNIKSNNSGEQTDLDAKSAGYTSMQDYLHDILMELREQNIKQRTIKRCLLFFTILTVILLIASIILYNRMVDIFDEFSSIFARY